MSEEDYGASKYSSGVNIIIRIDSLWKKTHQYAESGFYGKWNLTLDRIWVELARDLFPRDDYFLDEQKKDEQNTRFTKAQKKIKDIDEKIASLGFHDSTSVGFEEVEKEKLQQRAEVYEVLMQKQIFLARLENSLGKGTTLAEDEEGYG